MSLFNNLFKSKDGNESENIPWNSLESMQILEEIKLKSNSKPQIIFKHSTRCGISRMVLKRFENQIDMEQMQSDFYYLDLLNHRDLSNTIAEDYQIAHQSPQLIIIKNETAVLNASHYDITNVDIKQFI